MSNQQNVNALHSLLAIENDRSKKKMEVLLSVNASFKKSDHFDGLTKVYTPFVDGPGVDQIPPETKRVAFTVMEKLLSVKEAFANSFDITISKEMTNSSGNAMADLVFNGKNFGSFSATALLAMEKEFLRLKEVFTTIPTLDETTDWKEETNSGRNIYVSPPETKFRTIKQNKVLVLSPATDKHPAQTQLVNEELQVGKYQTVYHSGRLPQKEKMAILKNLETSLIAIKEAKERANQTPALQVKRGEELFDHILSFRS